MKSLLCFCFLAIITLSVTSQNVTDEYGELSYNGYLTGLNGAGNFVSIPSSVIFNQISTASMEMWIYPMSVAGTRQLIGKGVTSNVQFIWGLYDNLQYFRIGTTSVINTAGVAIPANQWTHVAVTWTVGNPFTVTFYVNGALSGNPQPLANAWVTNTDPIRIGGPSGGLNSEVFNGYIDEVRIWETQRSAVQIAENRFTGIGDGANSNSSGALTNSTAYSGLIASWNFNRTGTAFDYISGYDGSYTGSAYSQQTLAGSPIPYNFALKCNGTGGTNNVSIPHNSNFNQSSDGTMEAWVYTTVNNQTKEIVAKGNSSNVSFVFGMASNGKLYARFGNMSTINNDGITIPVNQWTHVAWVYVLTGGAFNIRFYVNGQLSGTPLNNTGVFNSNTDPLTIGNGLAFPSEAWIGFIDEVRFWSIQKSQDWLRAYMFGSARGITSTTGLIGAWNFDGNLLNRSSITGINGSFNTGGPNDCRLSGFVNETTTGAPGVTFVSHSTVVNRQGAGNPFPGGFGMRVPLKPILDNQTIRDTINISGSTGVSAIEVFLSVRHTWVSDMNITLRSPNGQIRDLTSGNGTSGDNILTFFVDGQTSVTTPSFLAPWSNVCASEQTLGNFGGSPSGGAWILEISDVFTGDQGTLLGWGLRINNTITTTQSTGTNIPSKFNLYQNYPNPFNPETYISFDLPKDVNMKLAVYDILGREVMVLIDEYKQAGQHKIRFDASGLASGTYFYRLDAKDFSDVKKMVILK
ncbi:MAG: T9SS type A sorting domain-containing protein [Ignavibacteria bacterium]|nr:T9SS type A sorting domain-containing protein [Ignavibacteria bacterium]